MDLLAAVDWAVASGIADPERLGIGGWSYGGILTDYTIATDPRFKAAFSGAEQRGCSCRSTAWTSTSSSGSRRSGRRGRATDVYTKVSYPFLHADRIKTPTLFMGGQIDFNVPIAGVRADVPGAQEPRRRHAAGDLPGPAPRLTVPSYQRDRLARWVGWYDRFLKK